MLLDTSKSMIRSVKRICGSHYAPGVLIAIFIMSTSVVENRVIEGPYTDTDVLHHKAEVTGKHGAAGRGLTYQIIFDKEYKYDIKIQGYDFNSINHDYSLGYGSRKDIENLSVGLVRTHIDNIYYTVYVNAGDEVLLSSSDGLHRVNKINAEQVKWRVCSSLIAFAFLSLFFRFLRK
ncbi:hypothetical protein [Vibrio sp. IB15]|uniref:hypothetical protein n=1 Tax=Vibrio sp. IB15 TaxID=2779368 RepID=UPI001E4C61A6|nr:hypothetical protein [Vibrio sp. IB15]